MIKKCANTIEAYEKTADYYDYLNRILASFAEIYNYNYTLSSLIEDGSLYKKEEPTIREDGLLGRIRAFYNLNQNEEEIPIKMYYNEPTFQEQQKNEYGYLTGNHQEIELIAADMIALSIRLLEACGLKELVVELNVSEKYKQNLYNNLDCLDIEYEEKDLKSNLFTEINFKIIKEMENKEKITLIEGGSLNEKSYEISGIPKNFFAFFGTLENLIKGVEDKLNIREKILDIVVTYQEKEEMEYALYLTQELRLNGFKTEMIKRTTKEFIKKHYNTKYVIQAIKENIKKSEIILTDLYTNEKETIKEMDLINHLDMRF